MTTITIATHKGGTGKTVTSMALAAALAHDGRTTLLVDLDPQGHSTLGLGLELRPKDLTLRDVLAEPPRPLVDIIRATTVPNLAILPSTIHVERIAQAQYMRPRRDVVLRKALATLPRPPEYVVIDCPPSLGPLTENGIAAADWILVPCVMEARAQDGLVDVLDLIALLKGENFSNWRIVYTKYNTRTSVTNAAVQEQLAPYQAQTLETRIPQSEPLNQAQIAGLDIFTYEADSRGALAYRALATELTALTGDTVRR